MLSGIADDPLADLREAARERKKAREAALKEAGGGGEDEEAEPAPAESQAADVDDEATTEAGADEDAATEAGTGPEGREGDAAKEDEPAPRPVRFGPVQFNRDGSQAVVQAYSADNKDRWIAAIDLEAGELRPLHRMTDAAWINYAVPGPGHGCRTTRRSSSSPRRPATPTST